MPTMKQRDLGGSAILGTCKKVTRVSRCVFRAMHTWIFPVTAGSAMTGLCKMVESAYPTSIDKHFMTISLTEQQILGVLPRVRPGLQKYLWIQEQVAIGPSRVAAEDFQQRFNGFYRVRRNAEWRKVYYQLLACNLLTGIEFCDALKSMLDSFARYEASYVSKLVATICPAKPVIDSWVLKNVGLKLPAAYAPNRFSGICDVYASLELDVKRFLTSQLGSFLVLHFREHYPDADITEVKMLDLVLWQMRGNA